AGLLDNMVVQKTYTPDQPGEFGGGVVDLKTREFPGQKVWNVSVGTGYNSVTTGKDFRGYHGGGTDFLGFDDGTRELPKEVPDFKVIANALCEGDNCLTSDDVTQIARSFNLDWRTEKSSGELPRSFSGSYGNEVEFLGKPMGLLGSVTYSNGFQSQDRVENYYNGGSGAGGALSPRTEYGVNESTSSVLWGSIASLGYRLGDFHTLSLNAMYNRSADDTYRLYEGTNYDFGVDIRETRLEYTERGIFTGTVGMKHNLPALFGSLFEWKLGYSNSQRNEPDRRDYLYENQSDTYILSTRAGANGFTQTYSDLNEDLRTADTDLSIPFRQWGGLESKVKAGAHFSTKERSFHYRRFTYTPPRSNAARSLPPESLLVADNIAERSSTRGLGFRELTGQRQLRRRP
ncbi:MAG: hypothetical protein R3E12_15930, partial [Candidatus Eisenbacteria bacterium]